MLPVRNADHLNTGSCQSFVDGKHITVGGGDNGLLTGDPLDQDLIDTGGGGGFVHPQAGSGVGLGVKVTEEDSLSLGP